MAKRKSAASANGENEQPKHHSSKRQKSTTTTTTQAPPAVSIKIEEPGLVPEHKSVTSKQNIHKSVTRSSSSILKAYTYPQHHIR